MTPKLLLSRNLVSINRTFSKELSTIRKPCNINKISKHTDKKVRFSMKHNPPIRSSTQSRKYQADVTEDLQIFLCLHRRYNATMIFSRCHQAPSRELEEWIVSSFQSLGDRLETRCGELETTFDRRLDAAEKRVQLIAEGAGLERHVSAGDDDEDRKRLKVARQATDFSEPLHSHRPCLGTLCRAPFTLLRWRFLLPRS